MLKKTVLPILLAAVWISFSEFFRNEFLFNDIWQNHYQALGLKFPSEPINGAVWGLWSLLFAVALYLISRKFNTKETTFIGWFMAFVLMWVVTGNMDVLPFKILLYAVPLSILETFVATWIIVKLATNKLEEAPQIKA